METISRPRRVLIIDDNASDRETYRRLISRGMSHEFEFIEAASGEEGLRLYRSEKPECTLLDYNIPDLSGLEFLDRLGGEDDPEANPIVMLTGQGSERVAVQALKLGAQDYLIKHQAAESLKHVVHALIEKGALFRHISAQRQKLDIAAQELAANEQRYRLWGAQVVKEAQARFRSQVGYKGPQAS